MAEQKIELRKIRDLSENLNDTFTFIRQNFKPLVTSFIGIAGFIMLANAILTGMYQRQAETMFRDLIQGDRSINSPFQLISPAYFLVLTLTWINFIAMNTVVSCYMNLYDKFDGRFPTIPEVWEEFKKYILKVFFYSVPVTLATLIGFSFCILPGVYLAVVFTPFTMVLIAEDHTFSGAWNRCFNIIKNNFWPSLGIYVLVYFIYAMCARIISLIFGMVTGLISYFTTKDISESLTIASSVLSIFSFVFYIVFYVSVCLHYFNLAERHDGTGMMRRLDNLGKAGNEFDNIDEQY